MSDIVATCAAYWLGAKESAERLTRSEQLLADTKTALAEAGLEIDITPETPDNIRHMVEVLIEEFGIDALAAPVKKELKGIEIAG
jgi:heterodisulfide reductase subunit B